MFGSLILLSGLALFTSVTAYPAYSPPATPQLFEVLVGSLEGNTTYTPPYITGAKPGDVVAFLFSRKNHTVTQSSFYSPCSPLAGGIDTGFTHAVGEGQAVNGSFSFNVTSEDPSWFYCRQKGHCQLGMVFAVNPTEDECFEEFQERAKASTPPK